MADAATVAALLVLLVGRFIAAEGDGPRAVAPGPVAATPTPVEPVTGPTPDPDVFDPDIAAFIPIGVPDVRLPNGTRGAVQLQVDDRGPQVVRRTDVSRYPRDAAFGAVVLAADLDGDSRGDLILGAGRPTRAGRPSPSGGVHILPGGRKGVDPARDTVLTSPGSPGDGFGSSVAVSSGDHGVDLWVGAPGTTVNGLRGAGAVYRYSIAKGGKATLLEDVTLPSPKEGDSFGQVMVGVFRAGTGVVVGLPKRDVDDIKDAGSIVQLEVDESHPKDPAQLMEWNQDSPGVPGRAEEGDRFGASLAANGTAVGIPGEDLGTKTDAGAVQLFPDTDGAMSPGEQVTLDGHDTPRWVARAGDRFGESLATAFTVEPTNYLYVGAPGRDAGGRQDTGEVFYFDTILFQPDRTDAQPSQLVMRSVRLGAGLPGRPETGARLGQVLGTRFGPYGYDENYWSEVLVAAPGADGGRGIVLRFRDRQPERTTRFTPAVPGGTGFGSAMPALTPNT